jgi:hypothetical protein
MKLISSTLACLLTLSALDLPSAWAAENDSAAPLQEAKVSQSPAAAPRGPADAIRKAQIVIDAKFIETNSGKQDVLSAPRVTMIEGNKGTINVVRELTVSLPGGGKEARQTVQIGYNIEATPFMQGDEILLRCNMTATTVIGKPTDTPTSASLSTRSLSTAVVMLAKPGKSSRFVLGEEDERTVAVELTASIAQLEANAAPIYWQAFAAMPKMSKEETALLAMKPGDPLDKAAAEKLVAKLENSLALLNAAAAISKCDWEVNLAEGPSLQLPYVSKAVELAKAARLRARLRLLEGYPGAAVSDLVASQRLARAAGQPGLFINLLVQISIERAAIQTVAAHFGKFDKAALQQLAAATADYDRKPSIKHAIEIEKRLGSQSSSRPWPITGPTPPRPPMNSSRRSGETGKASRANSPPGKKITTNSPASLGCPTRRLSPRSRSSTSGCRKTRAPISFPPPPCQQWERPTTGKPSFSPSGPCSPPPSRCNSKAGPKP